MVREGGKGDVRRGKGGRAMMVGGAERKGDRMTQKNGYQDNMA